MKRKDIQDFETIQGQMSSFHAELTTLVKKSPNDALNEFKLSLANSLLAKANTFLGKSKLPLTSFEQFDKANMPTNSDVLLVLAQYLSALEKLRADNIELNYGSWYWVIQDDMDGLNPIRTAPPKKIVN